MMAEAEPGAPYAEIEVGKRGGQIWRYRFFGRGVWKIFFKNDWRPINATLVHAEALAVAAAQVVTVPMEGHMVEGADGKPTTHFERWKGSAPDNAGEAPGGGVTVGMPSVQGTGQDDP